MSLPRFFSRVDDSISPLLVGADVRGFLADKTVCLVVPADIERHPFHAAGFQLLVNLCARLYPAIQVMGSQWMAEDARRTIREINPACDLDSSARAAATVCWSCPPRDDACILVGPSGWEVVIDLTDA